MAGSTLRTIREQVARLLVTYDNDITRIRNSQSDVRIRNTVQYNSLPSRAEVSRIGWANGKGIGDLTVPDRKGLGNINCLRCCLFIGGIGALLTPVLAGPCGGHGGCDCY